MCEQNAKTDPGHLILLREPASVWTEGFPLGNGRLGAMVLGGVRRERVALNHDLLWRRFWRFQRHDTAEDFEGICALCGADRWDEAADKMIKKIPLSGRDV